MFDAPPFMHRSASLDEVGEVTSCLFADMTLDGTCSARRARLSTSSFPTCESTLTLNTPVNLTVDVDTAEYRRCTSWAASLDRHCYLSSYLVYISYLAEPCCTDRYDVLHCELHIRFSFGQ
jgi:hypothetical protein